MKKNIITVMLVMSILGFTIGSSCAIPPPPGEMYSERKPNDIVWEEPGDRNINQYNNIRFCTGSYFALGKNGLVYVSKDLKSWSSIFVKQAIDILDIYWTGKQYTVIGNQGYMGYSQDGLKWKNTYINSYYRHSQLIYAGGLYVAVGAIEGDPGIYTSPDGIKWTRRVLSIKGGLKKVIWENNMFIAVGEKGIILTSPDGIKWKQRKNPLTGGTATITDIIWDKKQFCAVSNGMILSSYNGLQWKKTATLANTVSRLLYHNKQIIALSNSLVDIHTYNNKKWRYIPSTRPQASLISLNNIIWDGKRYIGLAGKKDLYLYFVESEDGVQWKDFYPNTLKKANSFQAVASNGKKFVAVGTTGIISTSIDGSNWVSSYLKDYLDLYGIAWNGELFVAIGKNGCIYTSGDGESWTKAVSPTPNILKAVTVKGKTFIAVGNQGTILMSNDGLKWQAINTGISENLNTVVFDGSKCIAAGDMGIILYSEDGVLWDRSPHTVSSNIKSVASNVYQQIVLAQDNEIYYSDEEGSFKKVTEISVHPHSNRLRYITNIPPQFAEYNKITPSLYVKSVIWANGQFIAVGDAILTSTDGEHWSEVTSHFKSMYLVGSPPDWYFTDDRWYSFYPLNALCWDGNSGLAAVGEYETSFKGTIQ